MCVSIEANTHSHSHTLTNHLKFSISFTWMFLDCGGKLENLEKLQPRSFTTRYCTGLNNKRNKRHKKKCKKVRHISDTALCNRRCCLFSRVQQAERGEELLQRRAAESQRRELQTGHEVRHSERGEEHGCDAEPRPAARGTDTPTHTHAKCSWIAK